MSAPREPLHGRIERLRHNRWLISALPLLFIAAVWAIYAVGGGRLASTTPETPWIILGMAAAMGGCVVFAVWSVKKQVAVRRSISAHRIGVHSRWPSLDSARDSYKLLTGDAAPQCAFKSRSDVSDSVDAELILVGDPDSSGNRQAVSPFSRTTRATPVVAFNEAMLDSFSTGELVAVMLHLVCRAAIYQSRAGRSVNGVLEADSHALLTMHDHVALLGAIEKSERRAEPLLPHSGVIFFGDQDVVPRHFRRGLSGSEWAIQDRVTALRTHLGAAAFDVPESS